MATVNVNGVSVEMDEAAATSAIHEIMNTFGFIGTVISRNDVEDAIERSINDDEWVALADEFADDVYRFVMDIPVVAS